MRPVPAWRKSRATTSAARPGTGTISRWASIPARISMRRSTGSPARNCPTTPSTPSRRRISSRLPASSTVRRSRRPIADFVLTVPFVEAWEAQTRPDRRRGPGCCCAPTGTSGRRGNTSTCWTTAPTRQVRRRAVVKWLVEERDVHGFGTETIGTDAGQAAHFTPPYPGASSTCTARGRYGLQCLANLDLLPPTGALMLTAPLKIRQGSGSPLRVLALVETPAMSVAVVTGGSTGIGAAICARLLDAGYHVVSIARRRTRRSALRICRGRPARPRCHRAGRRRISPRGTRSPMSCITPARYGPRCCPM